MTKIGEGYRLNGCRAWICELGVIGFAEVQRGEPMRIIIRFKSGFELPITCNKFSISKNAYTGEIAEYDISGIKDNKLLFFRSEDVECVYREMTNDEAD